MQGLLLEACQHGIVIEAMFVLPINRHGISDKAFMSYFQQC